MANLHFWLGTLGIIIYALPMYVAGFTQASMWKQFNPDGSLTYGNFLETVNEIIPMYWMRAIGGTLYIVGMLILVYNVIVTVRQGSKVEDELAESAPLKKISGKRVAGEGLHTWLERKVVLFTILTTVAILIGGLVEIVPLILVKSNVPTIASVKPYTPLELEGRDIYIREGCNNCHSQMIRPFRSETERYGEYSKAGEFVYDRPFLWGSKRTGPDLARVGERYSDDWHRAHLIDPRSVVPESNMPGFPWLETNQLNGELTAKKMEVFNMLTKGSWHVDEQGNEIPLYSAEDIAASSAAVKGKTEMDALIAYLQSLGHALK